MANRRIRRSGVTLVEVLVSIGIGALLLALILAGVTKSRQAAVRTQCFNNLKQIGLAMHNYHSTHSVFPPGAVHLTTKPPGTIPEGRDVTDGRAPWTVMILPFLDEGPRYSNFNLNETFSPRFDLATSTPEPNLTQQYLPLIRFQCELDPNSGPGGTHRNYAACQGGGLPDDAAQKSTTTTPRLFYNNGLFYHNSSNGFRDITDGTSNTVMVGETKYIGTPKNFPAPKAWWSWAAAIRSSPVHPSLFNISATVDPINFPQNGEFTEEDIIQHEGMFQGSSHGGQQRVYGSYHPGGANFLLADGTIRFLSENIDLKTYRSLGIRNDGSPQGDF